MLGPGTFLLYQIPLQNKILGLTKSFYCTEILTKGVSNSRIWKSCYYSFIHRGRFWPDYVLVAKPKSHALESVAQDWLPRQLLAGAFTQTLMETHLKEYDHQEMSQAASRSETDLLERPKRQTSKYLDNHKCTFWFWSWLIRYSSSYKQYLFSLTFLLFLST